MLTYNGTTIGTLTIEQTFGKTTETFDLQIRQGNCLAVIIYVREATPEELERNPQGKFYHQLVTFFVDDKHMKDMIKYDGSVLDPMDKVLSCRLNMYYKECKTLLKYFLLSGFEVTCYRQEPPKEN